MKEVFIAYFDLLGFKEFILNNTEEEMFQTMEHLYRDIERALSGGKLSEPQGAVVYPDLSDTRINCLNISDTIIFYTSGTSQEDLIDLLKVAMDFNHYLNLHVFPVRGAVVKGKIKAVNSNSKNRVEKRFDINCIFGRGIVDAHVKAEGQNWAGTVIDDSALVNSMGDQEVLDFLKENTIKYKVPYKIERDDEEYVLKLIKNLKDDDSVASYSRSVKYLFEKDNKPTDSPSVQTKISNTIDFLKFLKDK